MRGLTLIPVALGAALGGALVIHAAATAHGSTPPQIQAPFDLIAADNGGRVEWASAQFRPDAQGVAMNLLATTRHAGWIGGQKTQDEIVFSFFGRQTALVASVQINPVTKNSNDRPRDVEIWTSMKGSTEAADFVKSAMATLKNEDVLQPIALATPVEARFVKVKILNTHAPAPTGKPGDLAVAASRIKVIEGERAGYASLVSRNPDLASVIKGVIPGASPAAAAEPPPNGPTTCAAPVDEGPKKSRFTQSKNVLIITDDPNAYRAVAWKTSETDSADQPGRLVVPGVSFTWLTTAVAAPAHLLTADTIVFAQACKMNDLLTPAFKQAMLQWVTAGHKVIIQDSDYCAGPNTPNYSFMPFPFATSNPGAAGAKGEAGVLENSTLASSASKDAAFIDTATWASRPNDIGDSNVMTQFDARWCGAIWAKNKLKKNGIVLAYLRHGRGLFIYDGFDYDQFASPIYRHLIGQELRQPFDPDYLPCSQPLAGFLLATKPEQKSVPMAANRTYTYPIDVLGNYGYTGTVTLDATVLPADAGVSTRFSTTTADLTKLDEAAVSLTVAAGPTASLRSKVIAVRGRDSAGKSNVLCLSLPERRTGSVSVVSALRTATDKKPTKNIEIILDASGSMRTLLGKQTRWATAQAVLKDVVNKLPKDFSVGLRAYGHTLPSTNPATCRDSSLVVPVTPIDPASLLAAAGKLAPRGETPLVYSILQTPADLKSVGGGTVILITDGEESCKGDFVAAAKTLKDAGLNLTLNIVGFTLKPSPATAALSGLAESTGGHYYPAASGESLARAILLAAVDRLPYRILDATGKEVARGDAGVDSGHELPPGNYTVVITAADQDVRTPVTVALNQDITLRASVRGDKLVIDR